MMNNLNTTFARASGRIAPKGWMLELLGREAEGITGNLDRLCKDAAGDIFGKNKVKHEINEWWSSWWPGETEGNWNEALVRLAFVLNEPKLVARAEAIVNNLLDHQEDDGYIGIYQKHDRFTNGRRSGELWTQSRVMLTLWAYYEVKGSQRIMDALTRLADNIVSHFGPLAGGRSLFEIPDEDGSKGHSLMIIEPLVMLFNLTGKAEYVEFCVFLYDDYSKYESVFPGNDLRMPIVLDNSRPFIGHGPHTCEQLRIPLLLFMATSDDKYADLFQTAMVKLKQNLTLSGSCKSDEMIGAYMLCVPENERVGFNLCGCTPLPTAGFEYCSTTELMFSFIWAVVATGDSSFADMEEWMIMNAAMAAKQHDGKAVQYLCADNLYKATKMVGDRWDYSPTHTDAAVCCAPNSCKVVPYHISNMWMSLEDNPVAVFYGPCSYSFKIKGQEVSIDEDTKYPFENQIRFKIQTERPIEFDFMLRIPGWSAGYAITINDIKSEVELENNGFAIVRHHWENDDIVTLSLNYGVESLIAPDGSRALRHGPLLYALKINEMSDKYFSYDLEGFHDINYTPIDGENWDHTLVLNESGEPADASVIESAAASYVWDNPPIRLRVKMLNSWAMPAYQDLLPIGSTILRRTSFPSCLRKADNQS